MVILGYPLVICYSLLLKMAIEILELPSYKIVIFHSFLLTFTRGYPRRLSIETDWVTWGSLIFKTSNLASRKGIDTFMVRVGMILFHFIAVNQWR